jgi:hypothetical protein
MRCPSGSRFKRLRNGAPASSRAVLGRRLAREDAGAPQMITKAAPSHRFINMLMKLVTYSIIGMLLSTLAIGVALSQTGGGDFGRNNQRR